MEKCIFKAFLLILVSIFLSNQSHAFLAGYSHRKEITIQSDNIDSDLTDFPLYVRINGDTDIGGNMQDTTNYYDIRFTTTADAVLPYEEESMVIAGGSATGHYWVQHDLTAASGGTIYVYYGKAGDTDGSNATGVWDANFKAVYHINETVVDEASVADKHQDSTTNDNDGDQEGNDDAAGKIANGQDFDGADHVFITANAVFDITDVSAYPLTISAWVNPQVSPANAQTVFSIGTTDFNCFNFSLDSSEKLYIIADTNGASGWNILKKSVAAVSLSSWSYITLTRNSSGVYTFYINTSDAAGSFTDTNDLFLNTNSTRIGGHYNLAAGWNFNGLIDDVRLSSTVRSTAWIKFEYNNINEADNELTFAAQEAGDDVNPTVSTLSPLDGATSVGVTDNLVITFDEAVDVESGNIRLRNNFSVNWFCNRNLRSI